MDNTKRREVYLRDRSEPTPAQRRRLAKHEIRAEHTVVARASRLRKVMERNQRRALRTQANSLIGAIRSGMLRPRVQRELSAGRTLQALKSAVATESVEGAPVPCETHPEYFVAPGGVCPQCESVSA